VAVRLDDRVEVVDGAKLAPACCSGHVPS